MHTILLNSGNSFRSAEGDTILDAAAKAGVILTYSCKTGRCSTCKCKVVSGETLPILSESGLTEREKAEGWILSCARSADSDLVIEADSLENISLPQPRIIPCRIDKIERLTRDVVSIILRLPPAINFEFIPGQYVQIIGPNGIRRSYSIANAGQHSKNLEFHIKHVENGVMSNYWFNQAKINDLLRINGPLGTFFLRDINNIDLIFLATGTGIAPVKSILESISDIKTDKRPRSIMVLWGGRTPEDIYLDINKFSKDAIFIPVLSRGDESWVGDRGYVQQSLSKIKPNLSNEVVYACGSDAMIHDAKALLTKNGLLPKNFFSDSFLCSSIT